jgi:hypothetical protein
MGTLQEALLQVNKDGVFEEMDSERDTVYAAAMADYRAGNRTDKPVREARIRSLDKKELGYCKSKLRVIKAEGQKLEEIYRLVNLLDTNVEPKLTDVDSLVELGVLDMPKHAKTYVYRRVTDKYLDQLVTGDLKRTVVGKLEVLADIAQKAIAVRNRAAAGAY